MTTGYQMDTRPPMRAKGAVYYRKPNGWITWGGYDDALKSFTDRGFQAMPQYGRVTAFFDENRKEPDPAGVWGPIMRHPDGPAEFPVSQIVELRWYKECPVPGTTFPQLKGIKVKEYPCPQCRRAPFMSATDEDGNSVSESDGIVGLGTHLQVGHKWDITTLNAYGERANINFQDRVGHAASVKELTFDEPVQVATPEVEEAQVEVETVTAKCECGWEDKSGKGMPIHKRLHCPLTPEN